jgi:hypothetical protein
MTPTFAEVAKARYIMLTTFTKDGRPKPTAVGGRCRRRPPARPHRGRHLEGQADP